MCGIFGFAAHAPIPVNNIKSATDIIAHRGPNDSGFVVWNNLHTPAIEYGLGSRPQQPISGHALLGMGHRRLSIQDVSPLGHQPMQYAQERYWIIYNGEIYNYIELRSELELLGHTFKSQSDTEVILAAYAQWGVECLHRFNGMWSFAIYDTQKNKLFLSRDRFGIKPLYYWISPDNTFYFASEIKQFTVLDGWAARLNTPRAYDFLAWGVIDHTDETLFDGVFHFSPGHFVEIDISAKIMHQNGRIFTRQWYHLPQEHVQIPFDQAQAQFRDLLTESVRLQMRSDIDIGSCLSGGLDSSSIVCIMDEILSDESSDKLKTFSAISSSEIYNEKKWIDCVTNHVPATPSYIEPNTKNLAEYLRQMTWHQDEPFGSTSIFAQWSVFQLADEKNTRVILDGQGADEQLFGYHAAIGVRFWSLFRSGRWIRLLREFSIMHKMHGYPTSVLLARFLDVALPNKARMALRKMLGKATSAPDWISLAGHNINPESPLKKMTTISSFCRDQILSTNLPMLLHWEDRNSMAHSIESRVPYLDHNLVEFSMALPDDHKFHDGITKRVLRAGMSGIIPDAIRDRVDKIGFATPESEWVRGEAADLFREKIEAAIEKSSGLINDRALTLLEDVISGKKDFTPSLWRIVSFGEWINVFSVQTTKH